MKQVLYVEDSATAQLLMRKCLSTLCETTVVSTLDAAFRAVDQRDFDLIISDYLFPEGDAFGFIEHVRQTWSWEKLPIVVVSASMDRMLETRMLKAGANEALPKPLITEEFRGLIRRMFDQPYRHAPKAGLNGVSCFQWQANGGFHQYCPETNLTVSGATKAEAAQRMKAALSEQSDKGVALGGVSHAGVVTHVVHELWRRVG